MQIGKEQIEITQLHQQPIEPSIFKQMQTNPIYCNVIDDLMAFTGLSEDQVKERVLRAPKHHFKSEFRWHNPQTDEELRWYYQCSYGYLFANALHPYWHRLDFLQGVGGTILDYGGGIGNNTIYLGKKGRYVHYFDINALQDAFVRLRTYRHKAGAYRVIPWYNGNTASINCIEEKYGSIILQDVLEHIPNYHILLKHLIGCLQPHGYIIENTPFNPHAHDIAIHLKPSISLKDAMVGMEQIETGIWKKK